MVRIYQPPTALGTIEKQPVVQGRYVRVTLQEPGDGLVWFCYVVLLGKEYVNIAERAGGREPTLSSDSPWDDSREFLGH